MPSRESEDHLIELHDGWKAWKTFVLRGAGFPVHLLDELSDPEAAKATDLMLDAEVKCEAARNAAIEPCREKVRTKPNSDKAVWRKAIRRLARNQPPDPLDFDSELAPLAQEFASRLNELINQEAVAHSEIDASARRTWSRLKRIGDLGSFREALTWQNRALVENCLNSFRKKGWRDGRDRRRQEVAIASYLQRYAGKNDTIGFFGPIAWSRLSETGPAAQVEPGPELISKRFNHLEFWGVDALARKLISDPAIRQWFPIQLHPLWRIDGDHLIGPLGKALPLPPRILETIQTADRFTPAIRLAENLIARGSKLFRKPGEVLAGFERLAASGAIVWEPDVPVSPDGLEILRASLEQIGDTATRARAMEPIDRIRATIRKISETQDDPDALSAAIGNLEAVFEAVTGMSANRHPGKTYAGRTLIYQDCVRDIDVTLGPDLVADLAKPLSLLARSSAWFAGAFSARFSAYLIRHFETETQKTGSDSLPFAPFVLLNETVWRNANRIGKEIQSELSRRWESILNHDTSVRTVSWSCGEIEGLVRTAFPDALPGWPVARYHSPDLMIAASSPEAINAGDYQFVLGELHSATNSILQPVHTGTHPDESIFWKWTTLDLGHPQIQAVISRQHIGSRVAPFSNHPHDIDLSIEGTPSWKPSDQVIRAGDLVMVRNDRGIEVVTRDGKRRFHPSEFYRHLLSFSATRGFSLRSSEGHSPRVSIGNLVVQRERWTFPAGKVPFASPRATSDRFIAARRWMKSTGMPRRVFYKTATEDKPAYLDFESPLSVDVAARVIRQNLKSSPAAVVVFSEMLPAPDQCWLMDREGHRYTSELRIALLNPYKWKPSFSLNPLSPETNRNRE